MLDKHRPYAHVFGMDDGVVYQQDGRYFYGNGRPKAEDTAPVVDERPPVLVAPVEDTSLIKDDMRLKENKALKIQMEAYGHEWKGVAHAKQTLGVE